MLYKRLNLTLIKSKFFLQVTYASYSKTRDVSIIIIEMGPPKLLKTLIDKFVTVFQLNVSLNQHVYYENLYNNFT